MLWAYGFCAKLECVFSNLGSTRDVRKQMFRVSDIPRPVTVILYSFSLSGALLPSSWPYMLEGDRQNLSEIRKNPVHENAKGQAVDRKLE
jgi:hypothetical protein